MENNQTQTISRKQLYALACVFLFSPFVVLDEQLSFEEKYFVAGYKKYWNLILWYLGLILVVYLLNSLVLKNLLLAKIVSYLPIWAVILIIFWVLKIFQKKYIFHETNKFTSDAQQVIETNQNTILDMLVGYNLYTFSKNPENRYFLKEGVFFSSLIIILGIFIYFGLPKILFLIVFFFWLFRLVCLAAGLDFFSQNIKNFVASLFDNNSEQVFAYPKSLFLKVLTFFRHQNIELKKLVDFGKMQYSQNWYFYETVDWKKIYNNFLIVEYGFFALALAYFWYRYYYFQSYDILFLLYVLPLLFILIRVFSCYYFKRLPHIPVFFELTNFLFWISKNRPKKEKIPTNEA